MRPAKCRFALFATLHFGGKGGFNATLFGFGSAGLGDGSAEGLGVVAVF